MKKISLKILKKNIGIGLLELMLALAIIAVMILASVKYYSSANAEQEATSLVDSFSTIKSAVENYLADNPNQSLPATGAMTTLIQYGYLPNLYGSVSQTSGQGKPIVNTNPWGGTITVTPTGSLFQVIQTNIPGAVCGMAFGQIKSTLNSTLGETIVAVGTGKGTGKVKTPNGCGVKSTITVTYVQ